VKVLDVFSNVKKNNFEFRTIFEVYMSSRKMYGNLKSLSFNGTDYGFKSAKQRI